MQNHEALASTIGIVIMLVGAVITLASLVLCICYLLSLQKALARCSEGNRAMAPGMVWLLLIPCVSTVWIFFVVLKIAQSLGAELRQRGIAEPEAPGKVMGLIMAITAIVFFPVTPIFWVVHWVQVAGASKLIADPSGGAPAPSAPGNDAPPPPPPEDEGGRKWKVTG